MDKRFLTMIITALLVILAAVAFAGCSSNEPGADIRKIPNGYGTIFVSGRTIEKVADTSTSTVVDWRREKPAMASRGLEVEETDGIVYKTTEFADGRDKGKPMQLKLNVKRDAKAKEPQPVAVFVPGGGFISCDIDKKYRGVHRYLVENGYAVAVMEYRVIGQGIYSDAVEDVRDAMAWIKEYGPSYGLDPDSMFLIGNSGGGYLTSLVACQYPEDIKCVVDFYGLCDIADNKADFDEAAIEAHHTPESTDSQFVYGVYSGIALGDDRSRDEKANPISYVDGDEPPFIHFHGDEDLWVSPSQTLDLHNALQKAGVTSKRYVLHGEGHGSRGFRTYKALDTALSFMDQYR